MSKSWTKHGGQHAKLGCFEHAWNCKTDELPWARWPNDEHFFAQACRMLVPILPDRDPTVLSVCKQVACRVSQSSHVHRAGGFALQLLRYQILSQLCSELTRLTRGNPLEIAELVSRFGVSDTENWEPQKIKKKHVFPMNSWCSTMKHPFRFSI